MIRRYSSRLQKLGSSFLNERLKGALSYDRIAGYFSPSIIEVAGEALLSMQGKTRMVCNAELMFPDVSLNGALSPGAVKEEVWREWCAFAPETRAIPRSRLEALYFLLDSGKLSVRVIPNDVFGLIHGKAGVITMPDGTKTTFLGSANESKNGWFLNYELLWEDDSQDAISWVEQEFTALWNRPESFELTRQIIEEIKRDAMRRERSVSDWKAQPQPAGPIIEAPVYRKHLGLWNHQKSFVSTVFHAHLYQKGARFILADQVGLGKTLQLAMAAQLMAIYGDRPVLIIVPKTLVWQWQEELKTLLDCPSAVWDHNCWVDENGMEHDKKGLDALGKCPRRLGIVSQGLIVHSPEVRRLFLNSQFECVIVDEAHRARRKKSSYEDRSPERNHLLEFVRSIAPRTRSLLLATATPVQLDPIEAWDLLDALANGHDGVLGDAFSYWRKPERAIPYIQGGVNETAEIWQWMRNPLPPPHEEDQIGARPFETLRSALGLSESQFVAKQNDLDRLNPADQSTVEQLAPIFGKNHNPFIRHIIRRTRKSLEETIDPETGRPLLDPIEVEILGEADSDAVVLPAYLSEAYQLATDYCKALKKESGKKGLGFLETLLLRRFGSTVHSGLLTAQKLGRKSADKSALADLGFEEEEGDEDSDDYAARYQTVSEDAGQILDKIQRLLAYNSEPDPKYAIVLKYLMEGIPETGAWKDRGCIIFSAYYDSVEWLALKLSGDLPGTPIGIYAGGNKSALVTDGEIIRTDRDTIKKSVQAGTLKILIGTDAASEGLNLQRLGTLINLDLPWNPTRLEQRKGRIQRIGQRNPKIYLLNLRYKDSVEDKVHASLSERLESIYDLFGQIPDTLQDVWVDVAVGKIEDAEKRIGQIPVKHPFELRYKADTTPPGPKWESCADVVGRAERMRALKQAW